MYTREDLPLKHLESGVTQLSFLGQNDLGAQGKDGLQWIQEKSQQKTTGRGTRGLPAETAEKRDARGHRSEDKWPRVPHAGPAVPARSVSAPGSRRGRLTCRLVCSHLPASARVLPCRWRGPDSRRRAGRWFCKAGDNAKLNPTPLASGSGLDGPRAEEVTKLRLVV